MPKPEISVIPISDPETTDETPNAERYTLVRFEDGEMLDAYITLDPRTGKLTAQAGLPDTRIRACEFAPGPADQVNDLLRLLITAAERELRFPNEYILESAVFDHGGFTEEIMPFPLSVPASVREQINAATTDAELRELRDAILLHCCEGEGVEVAVMPGLEAALEDLRAAA